MSGGCFDDFRLGSSCVRMLPSMVHPTSTVTVLFCVRLEDPSVELQILCFLLVSMLLFFFGRGVLLFVIFCVAFILTVLICLYCLNQRAGFPVLSVQHLKNQLLENFSWYLLLLNYSCLYFTGCSWNYYQSFTISSEWGWMNSCPRYWKETGYKRGTHVVPYHFLGVLILLHPFSPKRFWEHI